MLESLDAMLEPSLIGDMVLYAIQNDEFYIFSHPEYREVVQERTQTILDAFDRWAGVMEDLKS